MNPGALAVAESSGFPMLSALIWLPAVAAALVMLIRAERLAHQMALAAAGATALLSLVVLANFEAGSAQVQLVERLAWLPSMGVSYLVGVDGLSVLFLPLTALLFLAIFAAASSVKTHPRLFLANLLLLEASTLGLYAALDLMLFFCFFEFALIPSFWLIKLWGMGAERQAAASRYLLYMLLGSLPLLVGFLLLGWQHAQAGPTGTPMSFDLLVLLGDERDLTFQFLVFGLLAAGFAVKGPALPFHTWMPSAVMEGPIGIGAYLLGLKVGAYGFLRFVLPLTPDASRELAWLVIALELFAILYAGLIALVQINFRRLLVFASVSHVGLIMVAAFSMNAQAWQGALLLMLNAGIATAGLFLCAGFLYQRIGSTDLTQLGGLASRLPRLSAVTFIAGLGLIGVPGTSGFAGELLAMSGAYAVSWVYGVIAALGVILSAGYFLWFFQRAFFGPVRNRAVATARDLDARETVVAVALVGLIFAVGLYPRPLTQITGGTVTAMIEHMQTAPEVAAMPSNGLARSDAASAVRIP